MSNDNDFREYVLRSLGEKVSTYGSIPEFESDLKLRLRKLGKRFAKKLALEAALTFNSSLERMAQERIKAEYDELLRNPAGSPGYPSGHTLGRLDPIGPGEFSVSKPVFIKPSGNTYVWESVVVFTQSYKETSSIILLAPSKKTYTVEFGVTWEVTLNKGGKFEDAKVTSVRSENRSFREDYAQVVSLSDLESASTFPVTTSSGMATTPIDLAGFWQCAHCGFFNPSSSSLCANCGRISV